MPIRVLVSGVDVAVRDIRLLPKRVEQIVLARKGLVEPGKPLLKDLSASGVSVTELNAAEREAFVKATRSVYAKWKPQIGADLVNAAEKAIAARKR